MVMANSDFPGQQPDEEISFIFRHHRSVMTKALLIAGLVIVLIGLLLWWQWPAMWAMWVALAGLVVVAIIVFYAWLRWYYSVYIVTNYRIRQQLQRGLFRKTAIDVYLDKVENISYNIRGIRGSLMGYGTIVLYTSAGDMVMTRIAHCEDIYGRLTTAVRAAGGSLEQDDDDE